MFKNNDTFIMSVIIGIVIIIVFYLCVFMKINSTNNYALTNSINYSYRNKTEGYSLYEDYWKKPIYVEFVEHTDKLIKITATSTGPDRSFGTDDDILMSDTFYNYPKIIGSKIGKFSKQAIEGYAEGLKEKNIFDKKE